MYKTRRFGGGGGVRGVGAPCFTFYFFCSKLFFFFFEIYIFQNRFVWFKILFFFFWSQNIRFFIPLAQVMVSSGGIDQHSYSRRISCCVSEQRSAGRISGSFQEKSRTTGESVTKLFAFQFWEVRSESFSRWARCQYRKFCDFWDIDYIVVIFQSRNLKIYDPVISNRVFMIWPLRRQTVFAHSPSLIIQDKAPKINLCVWGTLSN